MFIIKTKAYIPVDWTEATTQLESYLAVLATILGLNHDVVTSYQQGLRRLKIQQMPLRRAIADKVGEFLTPAIVVYYFQIRVRWWLEEQWEAASILPSPDFGVDFHTFRMSQNLNWLPNVSIGGGHNNNKNGNVPPSSPGVRNPTGGTMTQQTRLTNPHRDSRLQDSNHPIVKKLESAKMREAIQAMRDKGKGPLSRPDGQERCHSWHLKGACFSSKIYSGNGAKRHMPDRLARALTWASTDSNLPTRNPSSPPTTLQLLAAAGHPTTPCSTAAGLPQAVPRSTLLVIEDSHGGSDSCCANEGENPIIKVTGKREVWAEGVGDSAAAPEVEHLARACCYRAAEAVTTPGMSNYLTFVPIPQTRRGQSEVAEDGGICLVALNRATKGAWGSPETVR
eukprot:jgi/Psemu1/53538/gm1.53538_g